ncbi:hypothetical protein A6F68_02105 [Tsuneonella dongtanensis]|uniref:Metal-dependent hydrolase n=1 Tax=Tsuneonella dongtanensis TaxID=692370 RepID=A0A1B2AEM9_9SPHN|nr:hypothetical protein [Tsuneonella dongtanensis]ANY20607.1 hypothetical protein A6F68_02105 [Tsuneonella dongtanensis]
MFIGHWAPAFAAGAVSSESPRLGTLFVAAQLVDWAFMVFFMVGLEDARIVPGITVMNPMDLHHMPYTHSLLGTAVFAALFALVVGWSLRSAVAAAVAGLVVASHWFLDLLVHRPDLTLAGGSEKLGLGLWNQPLIEIPLELGITIGAFAWYMRATKGPVGPPLILLAVMLVFQAISWFAPQPTEYSIALPLTALFAFSVVTALAFWVGRTRWHKRQVGLAVASFAR